MFTHQHYVPVLKWKQGEYQALSRLTTPVKDRLTPLIEVCPVGYDFETEQPRETLDSHLSDFGRRLKAKWQSRACFVDPRYIPSADRLADGTHFVKAIFDDTRNEGCHAIPVVSLSSDAGFLAAAAGAIQSDRHGVALRLNFADFDRQDMAADIARVLGGLAVGHGDVDLIIDAAFQNFTSVNVYVQMALASIKMIPMLNRWRTFTVTATSYPTSLAELKRGINTIERSEWTAYTALVGRLGAETRIPTFGDYGVAHPDPVSLDMRLVKPFAKLRYTIDKYWHIDKGTPVRTDGFDQFQKMCAALVQCPYFDGADYSAGDAYIAGCAAGSQSTGNLTTWAWVSTNRHLTKLTADLATLHGL